MANYIFTVAASNSVPSALEQFYIDLIEAEGHVVTPEYYGGSNPNLTQPYIESFDGAVFGPSMLGAAIPGIDWLAYTKGVLVTRSYRADILGMSTTGSNVAGEDSTTITDDTHPMATGFSNGPVQLSTTTFEIQGLAGTLAAGLETVSTTAGGVGISVIEEGSALLVGDGNATARRVHFPSGSNFDFSNATAAHDTLFMQAFNYAMVGAAVNQPYVYDTPGYVLAGSYPVGQPVNIPAVFSQNGLPQAATPSTISGALPDGLSVDPVTFAIIGTPTTVGTPSATIQIDNGQGTTTTTVNFNIVAANASDFTHDKTIALLNFEASGDLGNDVSGNDNDAAVDGTLTHVPSFNGKTDVVQFGGTDADRLNITSILGAHGAATAFFWSASVYSDGVGIKILKSAQESVNGYDFTLWQDGTSLEFQNRGATPADDWDISMTGVLTANAWQRVSISTGPSGYKVWVDKVIPINGSDPTKTRSLGYIGADSYFIGRWVTGAAPLPGTAYPFDGYMKDIIYGAIEIDQATVDDMVDNDNFGYDVIHLVGDSTSVGRATQTAGVDDDLTIVTPYIEQFGYDANAVIAYAQPMDSVDEIAGDMNCATALGKSIQGAMFYKRKVLYVPTGQGGTKTQTWVSGQTNYINSLARANSAMATSALNTYRGIVVSIGTNNAIASDPDGTVEADVTSMLSSFETDIAEFTASTPVAIVNPIGPNANAGEITQRDIVIGDLTAVAALSSRYHQIDTTGYASPDNIHFDSQGQRDIGTDAGSAMFERTFQFAATLSDPSPGTKIAPYTVDIVLNDNAPSLTVGNITCTNGTVSNVTGSLKNWSFTVTPNAGTGNNDISIGAGAVNSYDSVPNQESNTLIVAYNVAGTGPTITGVSGNNANGTWTITMSGGYTSPVSSVVWNGYSLTNIQEINGTQITADADFSGAPNVLQDLIVTDAGGASAAFQVVKLPAAGYLYVTATDSGANFPAWSYLKGITAIALNDGLYVEQDIGFGLTADQHLTSIDGVGVINYLDPNSYSGDVVRLDSASNYAADAPEVVNLNVGANVPPVQAITPVTGATPSQSYEGKFDILTKTDDPINGVDLGVTMNVTAESNATLEFSNDDTNWFTSIDVTETTQGRLTVVAPGAGQTLVGTGDANTTQFSFSVTSAITAAITDTISSTNPNDTITPVASTLIDCYGHTVDGVSSNYEQVTTDGSGVFNLVDAGWTTGTWIVSFRDNATGNDLGVQTYVVA